MNEVPKSSSFGIRLDAPTLARLDAYAERIGHKRGGAAGRAIAAFLDALEGVPVPAERRGEPAELAAILARLDALEAVKLRREAAELRREAAELRRYELDGYELAALKRRFWQGGDGFDELKDEEVELSASAAELRAEWTELRAVAAELKRADLEELLEELLRSDEELEEGGEGLEAVERRSTTRLAEADVGRWVAGRGGRSKAHKLARLGGGGVGEYACGLSFALGSAALAADSHIRCAGCSK